MANSYIDPSLVALAAQSTGPGWEWNPGQTFVTAFNNAQENQRLQQKRAEEAELASILLPAKRAEAEFNIKKLAYDSQLLEKIYRTKSAALDQSYRGITSAVGGSSTSGSPTSAQPESQQQPESGFRLYEGADAGSQNTAAPRVAASAGSKPNAYYSQDNFNLDGAPFEDKNPLFALATDDLGDRILTDPTTMGAGTPAAAAKVADSAPVDFALQTTTPLGATGSAPSMLGPETSAEKQADDTYSGYDFSNLPDAPAQKTPQSSGDPFHDWATTTLREDAANWKQRRRELNMRNARGEFRNNSQFMSLYKAQEDEISSLIGSQYDKLDPEQKKNFEELRKADVDPLDAFVQVATSRPRRKTSGDDFAAISDSLNQSSYRLVEMKKAGMSETSAPFLAELETNKQIQQKYNRRVPLEQVHTLQAELANLTIARDNGEIDEATYTEKTNPVLQNMALARREAIANGDRVVTLNDYTADNGLDYESLASELEKYNGGVVGISGVFDGKQRFTTRKVTDSFIRSVRAGNLLEKPTQAAAVEPKPAAAPTTNPFTSDEQAKASTAIQESVDRRKKELAESSEKRAERNKIESIKFQIEQLTKEKSLIVPLPGPNGLDYKSAEERWNQIDDELQKLRGQLAELDR